MLGPRARRSSRSRCRSRCRASSPPPRRARRSSRSSTAARRSLVSNDAGRTWREAGGGLPPGRAIAIAEDDPDHVVYAARNRLYVSRNGGVFWPALTVELPEIEAVDAQRNPELAARDDRRRCRRPRRARSRSAVPSTRAKSVEGRPISTPCVISISSPKPIRPWRARCTASGPAAEPVAGSSATPPPGANMRDLPARPVAARSSRRRRSTGSSSAPEVRRAAPRPRSAEPSST